MSRQRWLQDGGVFGPSRGGGGSDARAAAAPALALDGAGPSCSTCRGESSAAAAVISHRRTALGARRSTGIAFDSNVRSKQRSWWSCCTADTRAHDRCHGLLHARPAPPPQLHTTTAPPLSPQNNHISQAADAASSPALWIFVWVHVAAGFLVGYSDGPGAAFVPAVGELLSGGGGRAGAFALAAPQPAASTRARRSQQPYYARLGDCRDAEPLLLAFVSVGQLGAAHLVQ